MDDDHPLAIAREHAEEQGIRLVWATPALNGAAAVALSSVIGATDQPEQMLLKLWAPFGLFAIGIALGAFGVQLNRKNLIVLKTTLQRSSDLIEASKNFIRAVEAPLKFSPHRETLIIALGSATEADKEIRAMWEGLQESRRIARERLDKKSKKMDETHEKEIHTIRRNRGWIQRLTWASFLCFAAGIGCIALSPFLGFPTGG